MTTVFAVATGAQAAASATYPVLGLRAWSSTDHVTAGWASPSMNWQNPPVGRYFSRRNVSMW